MYAYKNKIENTHQMYEEHPKKSNESTDTTKYSLTIVRKSQKWTAFV